MSRKMKVSLNLLTKSSDPANGSEGDVYFNTTSKNLKIHNGTAWVELTPPSTDPTPFYMHTHNYDGEVDSVFPVALPIDQLGEQGFLEADGGDPDDIPATIPPQSNIGILDGGGVSG